MQPAGRIFVVSAPSGAGKHTVLTKVREADPNLLYAVSATTRPPREGEADGRDYFFMSPEEFRARRDEGGFVEWAEVHGNCYGTLWSELERLTATGKDVLLELDVQGMRQVRSADLNAVCIFIMPPSLAELERRLRDRGTETEETLAVRLSNARDEMAARDEFDHVVVNADVGEAAAALQAIIAGHRAGQETH